MSFNIDKFIKVIEEKAPTYLKESYDNTGFMIGKREEEIKGILVALDCTDKVIEEAVEKNCNLIFTHHPILFLKPKSITDETLQGEKILKAANSGIAVYSAHTNLDSCIGGLGAIACELLTGECGVALEKKDDQGNTGVGRIADLKSKVKYKEYIEFVKKQFDAEYVRVCGRMDTEISRVAVINGSGEDIVVDAFKQGAQCVVTGDVSYHFMSDFKEMGICVIDAGHYEVEWKIFKEFSKRLFHEIRSMGYEGNVHFSEKISNPFKTV